MKRPPPRLELDYLGASPKARGLRFLLLAVALVFAADSGWYYVRLKDGLHGSEVRLARAKLRSRDSAPLPAARNAGAGEYAFARETIGRLSTPWNGLFAALEASRIDQVALLSIEPDAEHRTVVLAGEARDYLTALSYVASLSERKDLERVHLTHHEMQKTPSPRPLAFTISAAWTESP